MLYFIDFLIYFLCLIVFVYYKNDTIDFIYLNQSFFVIFLISGGVSTLLTRKIKKLESGQSPYSAFFNSFILMLGLLSLASYFFDILPVSRLIIIGSLSLSFIIEFILISIYIRFKHYKYDKIKTKINVKEVILHIILLLLPFILVNLQRENKLIYFERYQFFLLAFLISWFIANKLTHNFSLKINLNFWNFIWDYLVSFILLGALSFFIALILELDKTEIFAFTYSLTFYFCLLLLVQSYRYLNKTDYKSTDEVETKIFKSTAIDIDELERKLPKVDGYIVNKGQKPSSELRIKFRDVFLRNFPGLFERLDTKLNLSSFSNDKVVVIRSRDFYNVEIQEDESLELFINLHEMNDIRRLNTYFIEVNKKLILNGLFISRFEPIKNRYARFLGKYPYLLARVLYFFDFVWKRVIPKLPIVQKLYFGFTQGKDRALSFAETLGRLYYSGFEIIDLYEPDNFVYFIAKKVKEPSSDKNPSYGPLFKMKRVGKDGKIIYVYKFRTMHPFSEYLQKFVYEVNSLESGGKLKNDFRITSWGKFLRKLWLDEFPMFINFFKGELKLVGVRPLSQHYFSLYPEDLKQKRIKYKPGLVPPFYADLPKTFDEIIESERKYLEKYEKNPIKTDIEYFFKAWFNIIFKKARSA